MNLSGSERKRDLPTYSGAIVSILMLGLICFYSSYKLLIVYNRKGGQIT